MCLTHFVASQHAQAIKQWFEARGAKSPITGTHTYTHTHTHTHIRATPYTLNHLHPEAPTL